MILRKKIQPHQKISSTFPGSWMVSDHCGMILGQVGVVWVTLSGRENGCDLFESHAVDSDQAKYRNAPGGYLRVLRKIGSFLRFRPVNTLSAPLDVG